MSLPGSAAIAAVYAERFQSASRSGEHIVLLFLVMGTFMDDVAAMLILAPLVSATLTRFNIDPIHFSMVMVLLIEFGFLTPPFRLNIFVTVGLTNQSLTSIGQSVALFIIILLIGVYIVTFVPQNSPIFVRVLIQMRIHA